MEIETARLILRPSRLADVPALFAILGDREAMRHTRIEPSAASCRRRIAVHEWRRRHDGYAPWTVRLKEDGRIIGWGGLYQDPFDPGWGPEVGYFFDQAVWGRGYATELVRAAIRVADRELGLPWLRGFAHPANLRSRHVLEACGFTVERAVPEMDRLLYRRERGAPISAP